MGFHTFDAERADDLETAGRRYRYLSREELLYHLSPDGSETIADVGSGTGFFTDDVAPHVERICAVDVQKAMHEYYQHKGVPENVDLLTANADSFPISDEELDGAFSTMTFHEFATADSLSELGRTLRPGGRVVVVDWSKDGTGEGGPPLDHRYSCEDARELLREGGFEIESTSTRPETFVVVASKVEATDDA